MMTEEERKEQAKYHWKIVRKYVKKLRFNARLQKMGQSNLKEMMLEENNEDAEAEVHQSADTTKMAWYLIDTDKTPTKVWNFIVSLMTIYTLIVAPYILVNEQIYVNCLDELKNPVNCQDTSAEWSLTTSGQLITIEYVVDGFHFVDIILNFVKLTKARKELWDIGKNYVQGYFIFDVLATIPCMFYFQQSLTWYPLKLFRIIHGNRLQDPLVFALGFLLSKYSKKR